MASSSSSSRNPDKLIAEAEKQLKRWSLFAGADKYERAAELLEQAGNQLRASKQWAKAAEQFGRAGELHRKIGNDHDSRSCFQTQADCLRDVDPEESREILMSVVIPSLVDAGKFDYAAKQLEKLGEKFANRDTEQFDQAIEMLEKAAEYYETDNTASGARRCKSRLAELLASKALRTEHASDQVELFGASIDMFDEVGTACLDENLLKMNAKRYFFKAVLTALAQGDAVRAENLLNKFSDLDYTFPDSREGLLARKLVEATQASDMQSFIDEVQRYDSVTKLAPFHVSLLLTARKRVETLSGAAPSDTAAGGDAGEADAEEPNLL